MSKQTQNQHSNSNPLNTNSHHHSHLNSSRRNTILMIKKDASTQADLTSAMTEEI
jgi:hypothetical protein